MLEKQPIITLIILPTAPRETDLVLFIILLSQVHQYTPTFKQANRLPIVEGISEGRDTAIGIDFEIPWFLLLVGGDIDVLSFVGETELFEGDGDFDAVGGGVGV